MNKLTLGAISKALFFCLLLSACDDGLFGGDDDGDMTEEEALSSCKAALATAPEVMEKEVYLNDDSLRLLRNDGRSALLVKKNDAIMWLMVKTTLQDGLPSTAYLDSFNKTEQLRKEDLQEDPDFPGYWYVQVDFPATDIAITYEVYYECADNSASPATTYVLNTPAICEITDLWKVSYERYLGFDASKEVKDVDLIFRFTPTADFSYTMAYIPYDQISATAYIHSANYSSVFNNFLDHFSTANGGSAFTDEMAFTVNLHELTGISEEELATWDDGTLQIDLEVKICDEMMGERLLLLYWRLP